MNLATGASQALPFFLPVTGGELFCFYHQPPAEAALRGAILYVHPLGDEMNKCRRAASRQARAFARHGYAVLQMDLWGCGDSGGEFGSANWQRWLDDLATGWSWLAQHTPGPYYLWCVRLGALLGLQFGMVANPAVAGALLWQPELDGRQYLQGLRRMQQLGNMLSPDSQIHLQPNEIGGYQFAPELIADMEQARWCNAPDFPICCIEFSSETGGTGSSSRLRALVEDWQNLGARASYIHIASLPFWSANEIVSVDQASPCSVDALVAMQR